MKNQTCCFTGHRDVPAYKYSQLQNRLYDELRKLIELGVKYFGAGGALGFDTLAALAVLKLREQFPHIKLILVLPCRDQTKNWSDKDIRTYNQILEQADKVTYTSEAYYSGCMQKRNRHLVDGSAHCICYMTKNSGGTAYTVNYAREQGLDIINLGTRW